MDVHFNVCKVKYSMLNDLMEPIFKSQPIKTLNIFINLDDLYWRFRNSSVNQTFQACGINASKMLISNTFNLIAHYRQWGARKNVNTKVYAYYTTAKRGFVSRIYMPKYRQYYADKCNLGNADIFYVNNAIEEAGSLMRTISDYIDGIYLIDTGIMEPSALPIFINDKIRNADWNILVSRDEFELQYATYDKFSYIYPAGELSKLIKSSDIWTHIAEKEKIESPHAYRYPPELITLALSVVGNKRRSIPKVKRIGWRTLFNILDDLAEKANDFSYIVLSDAMVNKLISKNTTMDDINNNLAVTNMKELSRMIDDTIAVFITNQLNDIPDYENLHELNRSPQMFASYPLNLQFLTDEGSYKSKNPFI